MIIAFDPDNLPVVVVGYVTGPRRTSRVRLAVDPGSVGTIIERWVLTEIGYDLSAATRTKTLKSATGRARAPVVTVRQLLVLGQPRANFEVVAHTLPRGTRYDGLLGLDFFRGLVLTLDFARGRVALAPPRKWWHFWR